MHSYQDLGVSAFKSKHSVEGMLGTFLSAVETGRIPSGSFLLVESFDRISRDEVCIALQRLLKIIDLGITLETLQDNKLYSHKSLNEDPVTSLIGSIIHMGEPMRSHRPNPLASAWPRSKSAAPLRPTAPSSPR